MVCFSQAAAVAGKLTHDPVVMPATQAMRRENLTYTWQDLTILLCLRPSMAAPECGLLSYVYKYNHRYNLFSVRLIQILKLPHARKAWVRQTKQL